MGGLAAVPSSGPLVCVCCGGLVVLGRAREAMVRNEPEPVDNFPATTGN